MKVKSPTFPTLLWLVGSQEMHDHNSLLRALLFVLVDTASCDLLSRLFLVLREGSEHILAPEISASLHAQLTGIPSDGDAPVAFLQRQFITLYDTSISLVTRELVWGLVSLLECCRTYGRSSLFFQILDDVVVPFLQLLLPRTLETVLLSTELWKAANVRLVFLCCVEDVRLP